MTWTFILYLLLPQYANARKGRFTAVVGLGASNRGRLLMSSELLEVIGSQLLTFLKQQDPGFCFRPASSGYNERENNENRVSGFTGCKRN